MVNILLNVLGFIKNNKFVIPVIVIFVTIGGYILGFYQGYRKCDFNYQVQIATGNLANANKIIETERKKKEQQDEITKKYLSDIETLKEDYEKQIQDISLSKLSNVRVVTECLSNSSKDDNKVPRKTESKSDLYCYTESELRSKIKRSMDIAAECDQLVTKYNSLVEQCR